MSACCMVFDESGNAFDAFDWTTEELEAAARRCSQEVLDLEGVTNPSREAAA